MSSQTPGVGSAPKNIFAEIIFVCLSTIADGTILGMSKPVIFISGPFRGRPNIEWNRQQNIRRAEEAALHVWRSGAVAICPHKNTEHFDGAADDAIWLDGDLEILSRCDAIFMVQGWNTSQGAEAEVKFAREHGISTLYTLDDLYAYLSAWAISHSTS